MVPDTEDPDESRSLYLALDDDDTVIKAVPDAEGRSSDALKWVREWCDGRGKFTVRRIPRDAFDALWDMSGNGVKD